MRITDAELMLAVQGMTLAQIHEARGWMEDCGMDVGDDATLYYVATVVHNYYDGGIHAFIVATDTR